MGKLIFVMFDIFAGHLLYCILRCQIHFQEYPSNHPFKSIDLLLEQAKTKRKFFSLNFPAHVTKADVAPRSSKLTLYVGIPRVLFPTQNVSLGLESQIHPRIARIRFHQHHKKCETLIHTDYDIVGGVITPRHCIKVKSSSRPPPNLIPTIDISNFA